MSTTAVILTAKYLFPVAPLIALYVLSRSSDTTKRVLAARAATVIVLSVVLATAGGYFYQDQRPFVLLHTVPLIPHPADNGFPSDHTLLCAASAFLILPFHRRAFALAITVACLVGLARIWCLIHSPLDIAASITFAAVANLAAVMLVRPRLALAPS